VNWKVSLILCLGCVGGCFTPDPKSLHSQFAENKIPAIKAAADNKDESAYPLLVADLDDPDPAIRSAAINALQQMTGQTLGYRYYDDTDERRPAVMRWKHWLKR
jgi:HEAT repeat protein